MPLPTSKPAGRPLVIAHRGYSGVAPEHTLRSYELADQAGADYLEQDLQMTSDGVLVVMHDSTCDRTLREKDGTPCRGEVIRHTLAELRVLDAGRWFNERNPDRARDEYIGLKVPTLEEVFITFGHSARYYIETKNPEEAPGMEEELLRLLRAYKLTDQVESPPRVILQSFSSESLRKLHALDPSLFLVQLLDEVEQEGVEALMMEIAEYANGIGPHSTSVDEKVVLAAHDAGLVVHPYTVNDPEEMRRLQRIGIDGFFTDYTPLALRTLEAGV
ncbi:MAG: glycerophosphodiester phosphodiesterase [Gemmatimonadota bacterium]|jgi:glycerophosphoryl diester phosphodiesterase|nr:glycerophosphodiester phosphodiesterase [Gemmatimonadota bacterium]